MKMKGQIRNELKKFIPCLMNKEKKKFKRETIEWPTYKNELYASNVMKLDAFLLIICDQLHGGQIFKQEECWKTHWTKKQ
jgi:hypothetical protein